MCEPGVFPPYPSVVYFARGPRFVKVGTTVDLVTRLLTLRTEDPDLRLAAWLYGDERIERYVVERFDPAKRREYLAPCADLDTLIDGIKEREDDTERRLFLYETLSARPTSEQREDIEFHRMMRAPATLTLRRIAAEVERVAEYVARVRAGVEQ